MDEAVMRGTPCRRSIKHSLPGGMLLRPFCLPRTGCCSDLQPCRPVQLRVYYLSTWTGACGMSPFIPSRLLWLASGRAYSRQAVQFIYVDVRFI